MRYSLVGVGVELEGGREEGGKQGGILCLRSTKQFACLCEEVQILPLDFEAEARVRRLVWLLVLDFCLTLH